jgi:pyrophosphatase PpaX
VSARLPRLRAGAPLIFDLDGTLNDSRPAIRQAALTSSRRVLGEPLDLDRVVVEISRGVPAAMAEMCPDRADELAEAFVEDFVPIFAPMARPYPGVRDLLGAAHAAGYRLAIVTSNVRPAVEQIEEDFGIAQWTDAVVTADDGYRPKPDPEPVLAALDRLGSRPDGGAMVGDSPYDVLAGRAAGLTTIAVSWGLLARASLEAAEPDAIADVPADLASLLRV